MGASNNKKGNKKNDKDKGSQYGAFGSKKNLDSFVSAVTGGGSSNKPSGGSSSGGSNPYTGSNSPEMAQQAVNKGYVKSIDEYYGVQGLKAPSGVGSNISQAQTGTLASDTGGVFSPPGKGNVFYDENGMVDTKETWGGADTVLRSSGGNTAANGWNTASQGQMSYFNPNALAGVRKNFDNLRFQVDELNNYAWDSSKEKKDKIKNVIDSTALDFAKNFQNQDEFNNLYATNADFQKLMEQYKKLGGDPNAIGAKIGAPVVQTGSQEQTTSDYLTMMQNPESFLGQLQTPEETKALQDLIPENTIYQAQIAQQMGIAENMKQYYFGSEEQIGYLQQQQRLQEEKIKMLEKQAKLDEKNAKAQANFLIEKNNAELEQETAKTEENRLQARNYMTGMLAKMGALKTTGAAPLALATLEQKYQRQAQELRSDYSFANKEIEVELNKAIDNIAIDRDEKIWNVKNDLSKSEEETWKEIFKAQNAADKESLSIMEKYASEFRVRKDKYITEAKRLAEKNAKDFSNTISAYDLNGVMEGDVVLKRDKKGKIADMGVLNPMGGISEIASQLEASKGSDGYVNPAFYQSMLNKFTKAGGTRSEFLKAFPPNQYTNPKDESLPSYLKFGSSARSEENETDVDTTELLNQLNSMIGEEEGN